MTDHDFESESEPDDGRASTPLVAPVSAANLSPHSAVDISHGSIPEVLLQPACSRCRALSHEFDYQQYESLVEGRRTSNG